MERHRAPKIWIFASDEGFGHIVRQEAIIKELLTRQPDAQITVQTSAKLAVMHEKFGDKIQYKERYNNLQTVKTADGGLDLQRTLEIFRCYDERADAWLDMALREKPDFDFCISDFVPEAFQLARFLNRPSFGVAHFTWDWFFDILYPKEHKRIEKMESYVRQATRLYFPPFTPAQLLKKYQERTSQVSFIINDFIPLSVPANGRKKCLIMDNGTSTLSRLIQGSLSALSGMQEVNFYLSVDNMPPEALKIAESSPNITPIRGLKNMHSHIPQMDFILARGGFNTLTECLISKVPAMLVEEDDNPEVKENIRLITEAGYATRFSTGDFGNKIVPRIRAFIDGELAEIRERLHKSDFPKTGPAEICADIMKEVEKYHG